MTRFHSTNVQQVYDNLMSAGWIGVEIKEVFLA